MYFIKPGFIVGECWGLTTLALLLTASAN